MISCRSFGCTVIELLSGYPPYADLGSMGALYRIVEDDKVPYPPDISPVTYSPQNFLCRSPPRWPFLIFFRTWRTSLIAASRRIKVTEAQLLNCLHIGWSQHTSFYSDLSKPSVRNRIFSKSKDGRSINIEAAEEEIAKHNLTRQEKVRNIKHLGNTSHSLPSFPPLTPLPALTPLSPFNTSTLHSLTQETASDEALVANQAKSTTFREPSKLDELLDQVLLKSVCSVAIQTNNERGNC